MRPSFESSTAGCWRITALTLWLSGTPGSRAADRSSFPHFGADRCPDRDDPYVAQGVVRSGRARIVKAVVGDMRGFGALQARS